MPNFILRKVDDKLWRQVKSRAASEGISLKDLALRLFAMYAAGLKVK